MDTTDPADTFTVPATVEPQRDAALAAPQPTEIHALLDAAVRAGTTPEGLEKMVGLYERMADRAAAQDFGRALAAFRAECPPIGKNRTANITSNSGGSYGYTFADLPAIARAVDPVLARHGLTYTFDSRVEGDKIVTTCTLRHTGGHSIVSSFAVPTDSRAGMSPAQKFASASTFARRYALVQVLGLTTCDPDDDGAAQDEAATAAAPRVTPDEVTLIEGYLSETGDADGWRPMMLDAYRVARVADLPAAQFDEVVGKLRAKRGMQAPPRPAAKQPAGARP